MRSVRDDLERYVRGDRTVQLDCCGVFSHRLHRLGEADGALVDCGAAGLLHCHDEVAGGDGAEQVTCVRDASRNLDLQSLDLGTNLRGMICDTDF